MEEVILSTAGVVFPGMSVQFRITAPPQSHGCSDEGLGLVQSNVKTYQDLTGSGALFLNAEGRIYLDGQPRVTRLPALQNASVVSITTEKVSTNKLRVYIEHQDKQVTYEWQMEDASIGLHFAAAFTSPHWQIRVQ